MLLSLLLIFNLEVHIDFTGNEISQRNINKKVEKLAEKQKTEDKKTIEEKKTVEKSTLEEKITGIEERERRI